MYLGIDPGKTGAMAVLDKGGEFVEVVDFEEVLPRIRLLASEATCAYLEKVHSMRGQGVSSTFSFGENFGWWQGILQALEIPYKLISPQDWQKGLVPKKEKKSEKPGLEVARAVFPMAPLDLKKHHNRADALLIAKVCHEREGF